MKHILVVDDDRSIRELIGAYLDRWGFSYSEAPNGLLAIEEINKKNLDLVISDWEMPLMNGPDLSTKISNGEKSIPVIIITGKPDISQEEIDRLQSCSSFSGILKKPFDFQELRTKIEAILQK